MADIPAGVTEIRKLDRGNDENLKMYGSEKPPVYDETLISTKIDIISFEFDLVSNADSHNAFADKVNKATFDYGVSGGNLVNVHIVKGWRHVTCMAPVDPTGYFEILKNCLCSE